MKHDETWTKETTRKQLVKTLQLEFLQVHLLSVSWASDFLPIKKHPSNCSVLQVSFISGYTSLGLTSITSVNLAKHVLQLGLIALDVKTRKVIQDGNIPVAKNWIQTFLVMINLAAPRFSHQVTGMAPFAFTNGGARSWCIWWTGFGAHSYIRLTWQSAIRWMLRRILHGRLQVDLWR